MRKPLIIVASILAIGTLSYCGPSKKTTSSTDPSASASATIAPPKASISYTTDIAAIIDTKCTPCHFPSRNGNKKPLDNYAALKENIDDILVRVQLDTADKKFMPKKKPKLDDATISLLKEWKASGMVESRQ